MQGIFSVIMVLQLKTSTDPNTSQTLIYSGGKTLHNPAYTL